MASDDTRVTVLGSPIDLLTLPETYARLAAYATSDHLHHVVTLNPEQIMAARSSVSVRSGIDTADLITIDGVGLELALRLANLSPVYRLTGVEIVDWLARSIPTFLLGGRPGAAERARERLGGGSKIVGAWSGGRSAGFDDRQTLERIRASGATALAVAYGAPAQILWIERNRPALEQAGVRIAVGVGGALDYHSGMVRRAPEPVRAVGMEFAWRLISEPWRIRRQSVLPIYAVLAAREALGRRWAGH